MTNIEIIYDTMGVISFITIFVLIYLLAINWQLCIESKNGFGNKKKCLIYLRLLHISSLIETLSYLLNTYDAASSVTGCAFLNYTILVSGEIQLLWMVLAWEIQVRTMSLALQGPQLGILARIFWRGLTEFMIIIPIFGIVINLCTWTSNWDSTLKPKCAMTIPISKIWVLNTRIALSIFVHGFFFFQFLIQTRQASKMINYLVTDLKDIHTTSQNRAIEKLKSDASDCKEKAKSASRRNLIIGANAMFWAVLSNGVITNIEKNMSSFDTYLDRFSVVLGVLTVNCSFYLIFSEWKSYICFFCRHRRPRFGETDSYDSLLLGERNSGEHFLKRIGDDQEVEYFASPALIYSDKRKSRTGHVDGETGI